MTRIYTKTGDAGQTRLFDGTSVAKSEARVAAYGDVDELNAALGVARAALRDPARGTAGVDDLDGLDDLDELLEAVQRQLFAIGAWLADPRRDGADASGGDERLTIGDAEVAALERAIDAWEEELTPLSAFILPGGTPAAAALHVARTVARRAERAAVAISASGVGCAVVLRYLNRLSDMLFVAARLANHRAGRADVTW